MPEAEDTGLVFFKLDCKGVIVPIVYFYLFPETGEAKDKGIKLALREKGSFNGNFKYDPTYFLVELPVGTWQVRKISDNAEAATYLFGAIGHELMTSAGTAKAKPAIIAFEVRPGVVTYLGTIKMSLEKKKAVFEEVLDQEEEAAEEFRAVIRISKSLCKKSWSAPRNRNSSRPSSVRRGGDHGREESHSVAAACSQGKIFS
jgi:hypothetical protein